MIWSWGLAHNQIIRGLGGGGLRPLLLIKQHFLTLCRTPEKYEEGSLRLADGGGNSSGLRGRSNQSIRGLQQNVSIYDWDSKKTHSGQEFSVNVCAFASLWAKPECRFPPETVLTFSKILRKTAQITLKYTIFRWNSGFRPELVRVSGRKSTAWVGSL